MVASLTCTEVSLDFILVMIVKPLQNGNSTHDINSRPFICFICLEVTREWIVLDHVSKYVCVPENGGTLLDMAVIMLCWCKEATEIIKTLLDLT